MSRRNGLSLDSRISRIVARKAHSGPPKFSQSLHTEIAVVNNSNPVYLDFPNPTPGAQVNSRLGNTIDLVRISFSLVLNNNSTASNNGMIVRYALLEVKSGHSFTNSDVTTQLFEPTASGTQDTTAYLDIRDLSAEFNREPFRVIKTGLITVAPSTAASTNAGIAHLEYSKSHKRQLRFQDGDTTNPMQNRLTLILLARDAANDGAAVTVEASGVTSIEYHANA